MPSLGQLITAALDTKLDKSAAASTYLTDVKIENSSIVSDGVANIPIGSNTTPGVFIRGVGLYQDGAKLGINSSTSENIKGGTTGTYTTVSKQHESVFYGLAKAAGDSTQASSENAVGTYTNTAKAAIRSMLGIDASGTLIETVSGTTPSITGVPNTIYQCGEVSTMSITPPANGTVSIIFTSGSTATTLTVPNTVKFPAWFDATSLDTDTIYEIMITNGVYGSVMTWAAT